MTIPQPRMLNHLSRLLLQCFHRLFPVKSTMRTFELFHQLVWVANTRGVEPLMNAKFVTALAITNRSVVSFQVANHVGGANDSVLCLIVLLYTFILILQLFFINTDHCSANCDKCWTFGNSGHNTRGCSRAECHLCHHFGMFIFISNTI